MHQFFLGISIGVAATACMTAWELIFYRRFGLEGCLDWDINQHLLERLNGKPASANLIEGLGLHILVGAAVGAAFSEVVHRVSAHDALSALGLGAVLGVALWLFLLPLRRIATGLGPMDGRLGGLPILISLVGHLIYGVMLGALIGKV
ncbi:MAG TPA: hypothetical protein VN651_11760 [Gemmatimonadaceae bacterium]|nr:hypothetical protein [Gemmatimonadaceae bacterium]